jgi:N-acetylglucosaminyldiphosphoundecaprenol N-acetyl-beta-D-mannosaminyltransferase
MVKKELNKVKIDFLNLISTSEEELLDFLGARISQGKKTFLVTPNPEFFVFARHCAWFRMCLKKADLALPDGIGLVWASRFLGQPIKKRITGTDLLIKLCQRAAKKGWSVAFIGGEKEVAQKTLSVLKKSYPGLHGWAKTGPQLELKNGRWTPTSQRKIKVMVKAINAQKPDLLFVALGMAKQEKLLADNWSKLNVKLGMGVGGAFDYLAGQVPRAPKWLRKLGLEWFYRLLHQPWRWQRQLRLIEFGGWILQKKLT